MLVNCLDIRREQLITLKTESVIENELHVSLANCISCCERRGFRRLRFLCLFLDRYHRDRPRKAFTIFTPITSLPSTIKYKQSHAGPRTCRFSTVHLEYFPFNSAQVKPREWRYISSRISVLAPAPRACGALPSCFFHRRTGELDCNLSNKRSSLFVSKLDRPIRILLRHHIGLWHPCLGRKGRVILDTNMLLQ